MMFRFSLKATEQTDPDVLMGQVRSRMLAHGFGQAEVDLIISEIASELTQAIATGRKLVMIGSQMSMQKEFKGKDYSISLKFSAGVPESWFTRILRRTWNR